MKSSCSAQWTKVNFRRASRDVVVALPDDSVDYVMEIMTPRADMFVIDADEPLNLEAVIESGSERVSRFHPDRVESDLLRYVEEVNSG